LAGKTISAVRRNVSFLIEINQKEKLLDISYILNFDGDSKKLSIDLFSSVNMMLEIKTVVN